MKKKLVLLLTTVLFFTFNLPLFAQGKTKEEKNRVVLGPDEVVDKDYYTGGESVTISGRVNGDVIVGAGSVFVDGLVTGDLLAVGGTITITGEVGQDVRVAGGNISIQGKVGKNLTVAGGNVSLTQEASVGGSVLAFVGNLEILGPVGRDVQLYSGRVLLGGEIGGDVSGSMSELTLGSGATILGNLTYESPQEAEIPGEATLLGEISYTQTEKEEVLPEKIGRGLFVDATKKRPFAQARKTFKFLGFLIAFVFGFIILKLFPKATLRVVRVLEERPWVSFGAGILTPILFLLAMIFLMITIIGIPLALMGMTLFGFLVYFSKTFAALCTGRKILLSLNMDERRGWALFVGLLVYYLLKLVPVIGFLTPFAFYSLGLGAFVLYQKSVYRPQKARRGRPPKK